MHRLASAAGQRRPRGYPRDMDAGAQDRWRGALLAGAALVALSVGGWWWRTAAPAGGPVATPVSSEPAVPAEEPLAHKRFVVDAENGYLIESPEGDEPVVLHQEPGATAPGASHVVWEDRSHLLPGDEPLVLEFHPSAGERYLLVVSCAGSGSLTFAATGAEGNGDGAEQRAACTGAPISLGPLTAAGGPLRVRFTATDFAIDLEARLVALF